MVEIRHLTTILSYAIGVCGMVPLFRWLTIAPQTMLLAALLIGIWQDRRGSWQVQPWIQNSVIVPVFLYYALQFSRSNPIQPVVSVLAIMLAVRLSGEKSVRHSLQIHALSLFCLASSSLYDLSPLFLLYLGLLLLLVAVALVLLTFQNQDGNMLVSWPDLRRVLTAGLLMPLLSLPLLLFFFPVLPRTPMPFWNFLSVPTVRVSGYADKIETGSQESVGTSRTLAFRAEMSRLSPQQLYWRGTVFNRIEGQRWIRLATVPGENVVPGGRGVPQLLYPEPSAARTLIILDRPSAVSLTRFKRSADGVFESFDPIGKRLSFSAESQTSGVTAVSGSINRLFYLGLPPELPVRARELAADIRKRGTDDQARLELLDTWFRNNGFRYSMRGLPTGDHALEEFLFKHRQGHCEFFASGFALLLRAAGVPCRLVGGYLGGEYNQLGGYYLVTEDMAHVWVEVFIEGRGWLRIDPSSFAENAGEVWRAQEERSLMLRIRMALDSFNHTWNRTVITYDFEQQIAAARQVGQRLQGVDPSRILRAILPYLLLAALIVGLVLVTKRSLLFRTREERIVRRFIDQISRECNLRAGSCNMGLFEIAQASGHKRALEFVETYAGAVYRDRRLTDEEYRQLREILRDGFGGGCTDVIR